MNLQFFAMFGQAEILAAGFFHVQQDFMCAEGFARREETGYNQISLELFF